MIRIFPQGKGLGANSNFPPLGGMPQMPNFPGAPPSAPILSCLFGLPSIATGFKPVTSLVDPGVGVGSNAAELSQLAHVCTCLGRYLSLQSHIAMPYSIEPGLCPQNRDQGWRLISVSLWSPVPVQANPGCNYSAKITVLHNTPGLQSFPLDSAWPLCLSRGLFCAP